MVSSLEQERRRRQLNRRIRDLIAIRRAVGRPATTDAAESVAPARAQRAPLSTDGPAVPAA
jgi:hypothetical protein